MKRFEVLSPVGNLKNFYTAIKAGADAVYLGLPKFNARMKADNITLEDLPSLVTYAHYKDVKVYITLNTLVSDKEIIEIVYIVEECLKANVDAFIVQDVGLINVLRSVFPDIILHGSTQMGVHNVRGAKICKELGLTRVVLSREATIEDIREIANSVDIELEVFVQGAMCVCFSGNCYMSSIKHNASGNRGECKQLCRLPYTLSDNNKTLDGYVLSPRDNCMLPYIKELCDIGVSSFKIEGRLRHSGYVGVATNVYREAIDCYNNHAPIDIENQKCKLSKVFARGEFISGYNNGNDIIDAKNNNHLGVKIGKVLSCDKFKDIYRITLSPECSVVAGDGLKFVNGDQVVSMGVGNVDKIGNNLIVYGKNYIKTGSIVYKTLDYELENNIVDYSRKTKISISCEALCGKPIKVEYSIGDKKAIVYGDICEKANNAPMTKENMTKQLAKVDKELFEIANIDIITDGIFIAVSKLNELRRQAMEKLLKNNIEINKNVMPKILDRKTTFDNLRIVDENFDFKSVNDCDGLILSPTIYSVSVIDKFLETYKVDFKNRLLINLPIISLKEDMKILDKIVDKFKSECIFIANNIYALDYIKEGATVWTGSGLNIINNYSASKYIDLGVKEIIGSLEKWTQGLENVYKVSGNNVLMTFAHCPYKTLFGNDCANCAFKNLLTLKSNNAAYKIRRYKIHNCYFELVDDKFFGNKCGKIIEDSRLF